MKRLIYIATVVCALSIISIVSNVLSSNASETSNYGIIRTLEPNIPTDVPVVRAEPITTFNQTPVRSPDDVGCPHANYPDWETSPYVLPFPVNETYEVRLSNCSSSYHAEGRNDELAFDFVMDEGTLVTASRAGKVIFVEESGVGRERNNLVVIDHGDETFGLYMHLQLDGALVEVGDTVEQGDSIGLSGVTGLAGYPHLHLIVVSESWDWPYQGVPITFSNTSPNPFSLASDTFYTALPYTE